MSVAEQAIKLQRKIFSRWVSQKLWMSKHIKVEDIVTALQTDPTILIHLVEVLTEKPFTGKIDKVTKMRVQLISVANQVLKFIYDSGVTMKIKTSAENLIDGDERSVLALIFSTLLKFMKIGDEEGGPQLSAKDALLMWVQNKTAGYRDVAVTNFTTSFHSGLALCALVHKHRPQLVQYDTLDKADKVGNLQKAMDAAEKYFGLEKYITPAEVLKLDEAGMMVYVSEYFYGIAEQRKIDQAARRIGKLVKLTQENDRLKAEYNATAAAYKERLTKVERVLEDRTIDDTMAGAVRKLEEFYAYKADDKNVLLAAQLSLEGLYNNLAMRLAHHKRPPFVPPSGVSLKDVEAALKHLEQVEQERSVALHAELNRQLRLAKLGEQHAAIGAILLAWAVDKEKYLRTHPVVDSTPKAELQLRLLEAFVSEAAATREQSLKNLHTIGAELVRERYEHSKDVKARETDIDGRFDTLDALAAARKPVLLDDLAREQLRDAVRLLYEEFNEKHAEISKGWVAPKREYLAFFPKVLTVAEARVQLSLLDAYGSELVISGEPQLMALRDVAKRILAARHETAHSKWDFEHTVTKEPPRDTHDPALRQAVMDHEAELVAAYAELANLAQKKLDVLQDALAREEYTEATRLMARTHNDKYDALDRFLCDAERSLAARPEVHSSTDARLELSVLASLTSELQRMSAVRLTEFLELGQQLLARKYATNLSTFEYDHTTVVHPQGDFHAPELRAETERRIADAKARFAAAAQAAETKRVIYTDHLERELYAEETRVVAKQHDEQFARISAWVGVREAYLAAREPILCVADATTQIALLAAFDNEKQLITQNDVVALKNTGKTLLARTRKTEWSSYQYEHTTYSQPQYDLDKPELRALVGEHEQWVDTKLAALARASEEKMKVLNDHLARENEAARVRLLGRQHVDMSAKINMWLDRKQAYLEARTAIDSVAEALRQLTLLARYSSEREEFSKALLANFYALGQETLAAEYKTALSSYTYEHIAYSEPPYDADKPELRQELEGNLARAKQRWDTLAALEAKLQDELKQAHALEVEKERLRIEFASKALSYTKWCGDVGRTLSIEAFGFTLEEVQAHKAEVDRTSVDIKDNASKRFAEVKGVADQLTTLKVTQNIYTQLTMRDAQAALDDVLAAVAARDAAFVKELERQIENDRLCREFAGMADPFSKAIIEAKDLISSSRADLEAQLGHVVKQIAALPEKKQKLDAIQALNARMDERKITYNKHTTMTFKDVNAQFVQFEKFLAAKKVMLEQEIENAKLRGITAEQMKEVQQNFSKFDKDNSGDIDKKELTACLYSLGEERPGSEITKLMAEYGDKATQRMNLVQFQEVMIHILGDTDTKEDVVSGFYLINKGKPYAFRPYMEQVLMAPDIDFIEKTAPKQEDGVNFIAWCDEVFSR